MTWFHEHGGYGGLRMVVSIALAVLLLGTTACMQGVALRSEPMLNGGSLPEGRYTLILDGCSYSQRLDNAVFLLPEGGAYRFEIFGPAFEIKVRQGLSATEAVREADRFLRCSTYYRKSQIRSVLDSSGAVIGYEVRPLYSPVEFGREDVLSISYRQGSGKVTAYIWLDRDIDLMLNGSGGAEEHGAGSGGHGGY